MGKMPPDYAWKDWKSRAWASRSAIAQEKKSLNSEDYLRRGAAAWEMRRHYYNSDSEAFNSKMQQSIEDTRNGVLEALRNGSCIRVDQCDVTGCRDMQKAVDAVAADWRIKAPILIIDDDGSREINAGALLGDFICMNRQSLNYFLKYHDRFKAMVSHEIAHGINGDHELENVVSYLINPRSHRREVMADRMGAIIHGNPKEYAKLVKVHNDVVAVDPPYVYTDDNPSPNARARMLHKWADILKKNGATDETGQIIDKEKALEIFEISKGTADFFIKQEQAQPRR